MHARGLAASAARLIAVVALGGILAAAIGPSAARPDVTGPNAAGLNAAGPIAAGPIAAGPIAATTAVLPALPAAWPFDRFELGLTDGPGGAADLRARSPFAMRYQYLAGGVNTGSGWQTWNEGGQFVNWYIDDSNAHDIVPVFTYYMLLQSSPAAGGDEAAQDLSNLRNTATMQAYWADVKAFFQHANGAKPVVLHVEPDLWGYLEQAATGDDAATVPASVASSGAADLAGLANNAKGFAEAFQRLRDLYAPNVILAYHLSGWGTMVDLHANAPTNAETDALAVKAATFYASLATPFDIVFTDIADRDSGFREAIYGDGGASWWVPADFDRWARFIGGFVAASGKRIVVWQIPLGNTKMRAMDNSWGHYQDNRSEWFLDSLADGHLAAWRDAGVVALLFGGGASGTTCACDAMGDRVTNPAAVNGNTRVTLSADDDGGYFHDRAAAYYAGGGLGLVPGDGGPSPSPSASPTASPSASPTASPSASPTPLPTTPPAPPRWTVSGVLSPSSVRRGHTIAVSVRVKVSKAFRALVDVEIYNPSGRRVRQRSWDARLFAAGTTRSFTYRWPVAITRKLGTYTVKVGIFTPGWASLLAWRDRVRTFTVKR